MNKVIYFSRTFFNFIRLMKTFQAMWKRFGVKKARRIPYAVAVKEGWAQPPTNDFQRAVWDRVKAAQDAAKTNAPAAK